MRTLIASLTLLLSSFPAHADGGALRLSRRAGALRVSVFTAPTPPRAGPVDVSVLEREHAAAGVLDPRPAAVAASLAQVRPVARQDVRVQVDLE